MSVTDAKSVGIAKPVPQSQESQSRKRTRDALEPRGEGQEANKKITTVERVPVRTRVKDDNDDSNSDSTIPSAFSGSASYSRIHYNPPKNRPFAGLKHRQIITTRIPIGHNATMIYKAAYRDIPAAVDSAGDVPLDVVFDQKFAWIIKNMDDVRRSWRGVASNTFQDSNATINYNTTAEDLHYSKLKMFWSSLCSPDICDPAALLKLMPMSITPNIKTILKTLDLPAAA